ncbi:hypothetical protein Tco_0071719, partial [Tanacetum coccineum]
MVVARGDVEGGDDYGEERVVVSAVGGNHGGGGVEATGMEVVSWGCEMATMMMRWLSFDGDEVMVEMMCGCCGGGLAGIQPEYGGGAGKVREGMREARICYKNE